MLDRIVQERVARERQKYQGFEDLQKKAAEFDKLEEAQKTELQRAQERAEAAEKAAQKALEDAQNDRLRSAVFAEASTRKVVDPDAAFTLMDKSAVTFDETGAPQGVSGALDSLIEAKSWLVVAQRAASAGQGARGNGGADQTSREQLSCMSPEQIVEAQKARHLASLFSG